MYYMLHIRPEISCFETLYYVFAILSDTLWNKTSAMIFSKYTYLSRKFHMVCAQTQFLFFVMPDICLNKNDVLFSYTEIASYILSFHSIRIGYKLQFFLL